MLTPGSDRLDYGKMLTPPCGFRLDLAVGTTYSLDLDALLGAAIALGFSEETDSDLLNSPIFLLEALRSTGDRIALFCEGGQIHLPKKTRPLYALLDKVVFQITAAKNANDKFYPSFHPKMWMLRYVPETGSTSLCRYRFVVLSRNLTFDRNWDVAFAMEGEESSEEVVQNAPLIAFLAYLQHALPGDAGKAEKIAGMRGELRHIRFRTDIKEFYDFEFIPTGIPDSDGHMRSITGCPLFREYGTETPKADLDELFVMSPFLSKKVIRYLSSRAVRKTLVTRSASLEELSAEDCTFRIYIMKDDVVDGESFVSEEGEEPQKQDIHAKVYMTRRRSDTDLYVGSLNASDKAIRQNVEFMIRLKAKNRHLNLDRLEESLFGKNGEDAGSPFQSFTLEDCPAPPDDPEDSSELERVIKKFLRSQPDACAVQEGGSYALCLLVNFEETKYRIFIRPLLSADTDEAPLAPHMQFQELRAADLSEFYAIRAADENGEVRRIVKIPTHGIPADRDSSVIAGVVRDRESFYRYIAFLLGEDPILSSLEAEVYGQRNSNGRNQAGTPKNPPLYEKMLQAAAMPDAKEKFAEIDRVTGALSKDVVPDGFRELCETFKKAVDVKWRQ